MLPVPELTCSRGANDRADSNAILVVASDLTFIMASNEDTLRVKSFPVFRSPEITVSMNSTEKTIQMTYMKDNGFEHCNGSKSAVNGIAFTLENMDDAQMAQEMISKAQNDAGSISDTKGTGDEDTAAVTLEPKRSIALVNLWSPEGQQLSAARPISRAEENAGSDTHDVSPLQHRSQSLSQTHLTRPHSNQVHDGLGSETASETSFLEAAQDRQALPERFHASQSSSSNIQTASKFNARVDDAVARHKSLKLDPNAVVSGSLRSVEGTTTDPPHLPQHTAKQPLKSTPAKQNLLSRRDKNRSSKHMQHSTAQIGTVAVSPAPSFVRPAAPLKSNKDSMAKLSSGPPPATSTLKKPTKAPGGPAARLAGSQHQSLTQAPKSTSSAHDALKRRSLTSQKDGPSKTTDWDQDLRDDSQFDIPDDPSEDERPAKRARKGGKQSARKPTAKSSKATISKKTQATKNTQRSPGRPRNTREDQPPEKASQTVASTRERRQHKSAKYVEESGSENDREDQSMAEASDGSNVASSPTKDSASRSFTAPTAPKKAGVQRRLHSQKPSVPTVKGKEGEQQSLHPSQQRQNEANQKAHRNPSASYQSPENTSQCSPAKTSPTAPFVQNTKHKAVVPVAQPSEPVQREPIDDLVAEEAHDSYPMDRAGRDAAAASARDSFGTHLQTQLADLETPSRATEQDKENAPPAPETPFGNKKTFIANVNAAKSTSAKRDSVSQVPRSPETHAPPTARRSATKAKDALAVQPSSDIPGSASAARIGRGPTSKKTSRSIEKDDEALPTDPLQDESLVLAGDEPQDGPAVLQDQHTAREDRMASVSAPETSSDACRLGGAILEPFNEDGKSAEAHSRDTNHTETTDPAPNAEAPGPRKPSGGGVLVNDTLEVPPKKTMSWAETVESKKGQNKCVNDLGQGLKAKTDASKTGQLPTVNGSAHSGSGKAQKATADKTIVAREHKQVVRTSTALGARELQTPRRQIEEPAGMLTSEKINKKPSIVEFGARGPQNQGALPTRPEHRRSLNVSLPPVESRMHQEAKQPERQDNSVDTPSRQPTLLTEWTKPIPDDEKNRSAAEEGVIIEDDVELESARAFGDSSHSEEAREAIRGTENPAWVGQCQLEQPKSITTLPEGEVANDASEDESYHNASAQYLSPSSRSEEEEASEYEEQVGSADDSAQLEESRDEEERVDQRGTAKPSVPLLQDASDAPVTSLNKVVPNSEADSRESIELARLLKKSNPGAGDKISANAFRSKRDRSEKMRSINHNPVTDEEAGRQTTSAIKRQEVDDVSLMPPPKSKLRQSSRRGIESDALKLIPAGTGSPDLNANADRRAIPVAQLSPLPELAGSKSTPEKPEGKNNGVRIATAPKRVKRHANPDPSSDPALRNATPVPFHTMLAETSTGAEEAADRRKTGSYVSEDTADATLITGNSSSTLVHHPLCYEYRRERDVTETTVGSPPPSSTGDDHLAWTDEMAWAQAQRPPHRSLFENVMHIANVS